MRKSIVVLLTAALLAALVVPGIALAKGGPGGQGSGSSQSGASKHKASKTSSPADHVSRKTAQSAAKSSGMSELHSGKAAGEPRKPAHKVEIAKQRGAREASHSANARDHSDEDLDSNDTSPSVDGTRCVGSGVNTAFSRITANLEKSAAKVAAGRKKQLPPGLVRVWLNFAAWLGVDPSTIPRVPTTETSPTIEPTPTVVAIVAP
jgi:hypothetical protein